MKKAAMAVLLCLLAAVLLPTGARADAVTDTIGIYVGYYGWQEADYLEKVTYHWTELDDWVGGALDTRETVYSYYSGSRTYLVAARGFSIRDLLYYAGIDFDSIASIDFFTKDHANGAYRSFSRYALFDMPRYYFPNLAADEETGAPYAWDGDDIWNGATAVEAMLALEDYTEWDAVGSEFAQRYDSTLLSPGCRFHLFFGQSDPSETGTSSAAKYCYKILITFSGTPVLGTEETDMTLKIGSGRKIELTVDAEDGLLNDYVLEHITWSSSDTSVLSVAQDGTVSVHAAGEATVTAAFGASSVSVHVTAGGEEGGSGGTGSGSGTVGVQGETGPEKAPSDAPPARTEEAEKPDVSATKELPAPEAVTEEIAAVPTERLLAIRPEALLGMLSSPNGQSEAGTAMDDDSAQLVVPLREEKNPAAAVLCFALGSFVLGFGYELIRFRRIVRKR